MRKTALQAVVVAAVAVLAVGAAGAVLATDGTDATGAEDVQTTDDTDSRTITVSGDGSASTAPDKAVIVVAVTATGDDPAAIRDDLADGAADLRDALSEADVDEDNIRTEDYRIHEERHRRPPEAGEGPGEPTYRGIHSFRVELDDTDRVGEVVDAAAGSGAEVPSVQFTLTEETRDDLRDEALENAMADADRQAETLASTSDLTVTGVHSIDATNRHYRPVEFDAAVAEAGGGGTSIETGDVSVSVTVQVEYGASN